MKYPRTFHFSLFDYSLHGVRFSDEAEGSCYFLRGWDDGNKYTNLTLALKAEPSAAWREEENESSDYSRNTFSVKRRSGA